MKKITRSCCGLLAVILLLAGFSASTPANTCTDAQNRIVQEYKADKTSAFRLTTRSRFLIIADKGKNPDLDDTVKLIRNEFAAARKPSGKKLPIVYGNGKDLRDGDIVIMPASGFEAESYQLNIKKTIFVSAGDVSGIFYALRTVLQYLIAGSSNKISGCSITDSPDTAERTVHLDCARKYYSRTWIKNMIKEMSWMRYNAIEIHFSEDQALRLESRKFPWLAGASNGSQKYLTQSDMTDICKTARKYHIEVIPSFDSPGHMDYIIKKYAAYVKKHPKYHFTYNGKTYSAKTAGFSNISNYFKYRGKKSSYNNRGIDLANKTARAFAGTLIDEYADFFAAQGCTQFNIGGDELLGWSKVTLKGKTFDFNTKWKALQHWENYAKKTLRIKKGSASDTFISYLNTTAKRLQKKGYTVRVWNDEISRNSDQHIALDKGIHIVYWSNEFAPVARLKKKGYVFHNAVSGWCYYVIRRDSSGRDLMKTTYKNVNGKSIFNSWNPKSFADPKQTAKKVPASQYGGAYFCIWSDMPGYKSASAMWTEARSRMWASSVKMWNTNVNENLTYTEFQKYTQKIDAVWNYNR